MAQLIGFLQDYETFYRHFLERRASKDVLDESTRWLREKTKDAQWSKRFQDQLLRDFKTPSQSSLAAETSWLQTAATQRLNLIFVLNKFFLYYGCKKIDQSKWEPIMHQVIGASLHVIDNQRDLGHVHKIFRGWNGAGLFRDQIDGWESSVSKKLTAMEVPSSSSAEAKTEMPSVLRQKRSYSTAMEELPGSRAEAVRGSSGGSSEGVVNFRSILVDSMEKLAYRVCDYYHTHASNSTDAIYWRTYLFTTMDLLHMFCANFQLEDNAMAIVLASLFLAGKLDSMFLRPNKLKVTASKFVLECFGTEMVLPEDSEVFAYEMKLLQLLQFDSNQVCNPIPVLQRWLHEKVIDQSVLVRSVELCCKERFVQHHVYLRFSSVVLACFLQLAARCQGEHTEDRLAQQIKLTFYGCFREIDDNLQFLALWREYTIHQAADSTTDAVQLAKTYRLVLRYFEHCTQIKPIPLEYLNLSLLGSSWSGEEKTSSKQGSSKKKDPEESPKCVAGTTFTSNSPSATPPNADPDVQDAETPNSKPNYEPLVAKARREKTQKPLSQPVVVVLDGGDEVLGQCVSKEAEASMAMDTKKDQEEARRKSSEGTEGAMGNVIESEVSKGEVVESQEPAVAAREAIVTETQQDPREEAKEQENDRSVSEKEVATADITTKLEEEPAAEAEPEAPAEAEIEVEVGAPQVVAEANGSSQILDALLADSSCSYSSESLVSRSTEEDKSCFDAVLSRVVSVTEQLAHDVASKAKIDLPIQELKNVDENTKTNQQHVAESIPTVVVAEAKKDVFLRLGAVASASGAATTSSSLVSTLPSSDSIDQDRKATSTAPAGIAEKVGGSRLLSRALASLVGNSTARPAKSQSNGNPFTLAQGVATLRKRKDREVCDPSDSTHISSNSTNRGGNHNNNKRVRAN